MPSKPQPDDPDAALVQHVIKAVENLKNPAAWITALAMLRTAGRSHKDAARLRDTVWAARQSKAYPKLGLAPDGGLIPMDELDQVMLSGQRPPNRR